MLKWIWSFFRKWGRYAPSELEEFVFSRYVKKVPYKYILREWNKTHPSQKMYDTKKIAEAIARIRIKLKNAPETIKKHLERLKK